MREISGSFSPPARLTMGTMCDHGQLAGYLFNFPAFYERGANLVTYKGHACKTVQVKNGVLLFWRETKLFRTDCVVPKPHFLQNAKCKMKKTHKDEPWRLWAVRVRCQLPLLVDC